MVDLENGFETVKKEFQKACAPQGSTSFGCHGVGITERVLLQRVLSEGLKLSDEEIQALERFVVKETEGNI